MNLAILTGASAGLGGEYLKLLAADPSLDRIWIIARRADRLQSLCEQYPHKDIVPLSLDLTDEASFATLCEKLAQEKSNIRLLINNAGCGTVGDFADMELSGQTRMVDLNVRAMTAMANLCLPYMAKGAAILNVCSIASFAPNTRMAVYCSTKAYVLQFSKTLKRELKKRGINVCAACPGPMNTEFFQAGGIVGKSHALEKGLPRCQPDKVARGSLRAATTGRGIYTPTLFYKFYRLLCKLLPHGLIMYLSGT
jgi:short-subunit dehydrogenase